MTQFVGEDYVISAAPLGYNQELLAPEQVASIQISILSKDRTTWLHENETMELNVETGEYEFVWDTDGLEHGTYRYAVTIVGVDGRDNVEEYRVRLARRRVVLTP